LHLPAVAGNYASIPDAVDLDGFGDFTLQVDDVTLPDWTPAAANTLISKYSGGQVSWKLDLQADGTLRLYTSADGSAVTNDFSAATSLSAGATASLRVLRVGSVVRFYLDSGSGFAQLGSDSANTVGTLHSGSADVNVGAYGGGGYTPLLGSIGRARVWSDATQTTNVLDANFALANKGATSFTATSGQVVTVHSTAIDNPAAIRGATDGVLVNGPTFVVDNPPNYSSYSLSFNGSDEYGTMSVAALDDTFTVSAWVKYAAGTTGGSDYDYIISFGAAGTRTHFSIARYATTNVFYVYDGAVAYTGTNAVPTGEWVHVAMVVKPASDRLKLFVNGIEEAIAQPSGDFDIDASTGAIARYNAGASHFGIGGIDEVAIWNSALTSAQINDIYTGGVPAALADSPLNWWRMGEDNAGTGTTISDMGSGSDALTLVNTPTFSRSVPAEDATWNNRSLTFNGSDEYMTTGADGTLADKTYSFWAKSSDTSATARNTVFAHGANEKGGFHMNWSASLPLLYMGSGIWKKWNDTPAQDDGAWHHWAVVIDASDVTGALLYVDGILQTVSATSGTSGAAAYSAITIGMSYVGGEFFNGSIDEFAVFDGELTPSEILQIYNGGKPASLKEHSPESWWRMGDDDDTGGTTIRDLGVVSGAGVEEITNGDFASASGWNLDDNAAITGGKLVLTSSTGLSYQTKDLNNGEAYDVTFTVSGFSTGTVRAYLNGEQGPTVSANGTYTQSIVAGSANNLLGVNPSGTMSVDDFSVKTPNLITGFTNGTTYPLDTLVTSGWDITSAIMVSSAYGGCASNQLSVTAGEVYEVTFDLTYNSGTTNVRAVIVNDADGSSAHRSNAFYTTTNGTNTAYLVITTTDATAHLQLGNYSPSHVINFAATNVSLKKINGNPATLVNTPTFSTSTP
jgi:hypothetical protein